MEYIAAVCFYMLILTEGYMRKKRKYLELNHAAATKIEKLFLDL